MNKRPMRWKALAALTLFSAVLTADAAAQAVNLRVFWWGSQVRHDRTLKVLDLFQTANSGTAFSPEYTGGGQYFEKLNTLIAANDLPDVFQMGNNFLTYKDHLAPLDDFIKDGTINISNTNAAFLSSGKIGGKILGISLGTNSMSLVYDPELFKKAGVAEPTDQWTWADFEKAAEVFKAKLGIFAVNGMDDWSIGAWYYIGQNSAKEDIYNDSGTALGYSNDKYLKDWLEMKKRFVTLGYHPKPAEAAAVKDVQGEFIVSQKAAMTFAWSNQVAALFTAANRPLKLALVPRIAANGPSGMFVRASQHLVLSKNSAHKKEGARLINYVVGDLAANRVLLGERGIPIMANVRSDIKPLVPETVGLTFDFMNKVGSVASKDQPIEPLAELEVEDILRKLGEQVLYGKITPEAAAAKFRAEATKVLARK